MEDESSGIGAGAVAGVGAALAGGIGLLLNRKKAVKEARQFLRDTRPRDLTKDEVADVDKAIKKDVVPAPEVNDRALVTLEGAKNTTKAAEKELSRIEEAVIKQPLTMGGTAEKNELYGVGPALYDFVAKLPDKRARTPGEWSSIFRSRMELEYVEPGTGALRKRTVPLQEVEDAAIARYDKKGNLKAGVLYDLINDSDGKKAKLSIPTILNFVRGSPSNNVRVIKFGSQYIKKQANEYTKDLSNLGNAFRDTFDVSRGLSLPKLFLKRDELSEMVNRNPTDAGRNALQQLEEVIQVQNAFAKTRGQLSYGLQYGDDVYTSGITNLVARAIRTLDQNRIDGRFVGNDANITKVNQMNENFNNIFINNKGLESFDRYQDGLNVIFKPKYPQYKNYRHLGTEDYFEDLLYLDNRIIDRLPPALKNLYMKTHYDEDPKRNPIYGAIVHIRGGVRAVEGPGNMKALVSSEVQGDHLQDLAKEQMRIRDRFVENLVKKLESGDVPRAEIGPETPGQFFAKQKKKVGDKYRRMSGEERLQYPVIKFAAREFLKQAENLRQNPFNRQDLSNILNKDKIEDMSFELRNLAAKGRFMTIDDQKKFDKLADDIEYEKSKAPKQDAPRTPGPDEIAYMPFFKEDEWGGLTIRYLLRKAARDGQDFVALEPYELVQFKRGGRGGDSGRITKHLEWYGTRKGGGSANIILPRKDGTGARDMSPKIVTRVPRAPGSGKKMVPFAELKDGPAVLPDAIKTLAKRHDLEIVKLRLAKSDPDKPFKVLDDEVENLNIDTGEIIRRREHLAAFASADEIPDYLRSSRQIVEIKKGDPELYYEAFGVKVRPEFKNIPMTTYKKGGLVVDLFKWS